MRVRRLVVIASLALALAGCGSPRKVIDHTVVENAIATSIATQQHLLTIVSCPAGVVAQVGRTFTCTATLRSGAHLPVAVTATDDKGNVRYEGLPGYVNGRPLPKRR